MPGAADPLNLTEGARGAAVSSGLTELSSAAGLVQVPGQYNIAPPTATAGASPSAHDAFFGKIGSIFSESGHMFESAARWTGRQIATAVTSPGQFAAGFGRAFGDSAALNTYSSITDSLNKQQDQLTQQWKTGKISTGDYKAQLQDLFKQMQTNSDNIHGQLTTIKSDQGQFAKSTVDFVSSVLTVASGGLAAATEDIAKAGASDTAMWLASHTTNDAFAPVENALARLAANRAEFTDLPTAVQDAMKSSITDTFMNAAKDASAAKLARTASINMFLKFPLSFNYVSGTGQQLYKEMESGKYGDAAKTLGYNSLLLLAGGPVGVAFKYGGKGLAAASGKVFGQTSFLETLSKAIGDGKVEGLYNAIKDNPAAIKAFQALEATNVKAASGHIVDAVYRIVDGLKENGWELGRANHEQFVKDVMGWHEAQSLLHDELVKSGMTEAEASKYVVGRFTVPTKENIANALMNKNDVQGRLDAWQEYKDANPNSAAANNSNLDRQIQGIIGGAKNDKELKQSILDIKASFGKGGGKISQAARERIANLGYVPIQPKALKAPFVQGTGKLLVNSSVDAAHSDFFQRAVQPLPILKDISAAATWAGLSPQQADSTVQEMFKGNLRENLVKAGIAANHDETNGILSKLNSYVNALGSYNPLHPPITDLRQMTKSEIASALKVSKTDAETVQKALMDSMLQVPRSVKGLGNYILDKSGQVVPVRSYLRLQGAGRFAWNPFFKMKLASKTEILSQMMAGGKLPNFIPSDRISQDVKILDEKGMFTGGYTGEAANESGLIAGMRANRVELLGSQKRSLAGLVGVMADRIGMSTEDYINTHTEDVQNMVDTILHYNPRSSFLNSPLAKTLNIAIFPFRFNVKVGTIMAQTLAKTDPLTQMAVIYGTSQAHAFLSSQEGQLWYSQNSDAIGLLSYFTPIETIHTVLSLGGIKPDSIGSLGELGGLPVGFITQILQSEGLWNPSNGYVNPKTGQPGTEYIPNTAKAKLATAVASFLGSLYTYPGSTAGLPSKAGIDTHLGEFVSGAKSTEWTKVPDTNLTPQQQQFEKIVQQNRGTGTPVSPFQGSAANTPDIQVPPQAPPPVATTKLSAAKGKVKKSQEPLSLLPGQTSIGQPL